MLAGTAALPGQLSPSGGKLVVKAEGNLLPVNVQGGAEWAFG